MSDINAFFNISKSVVATAAKAMHKPSLQSKESMAAYAKAIGASGKKASFTMEQKAASIDYVIN